jgi:transposase
MINPEKRNAIYYLYMQGMPIRKISRELEVDRKTVNSIIKQQGQMPGAKRSDRIELDEALLRRLYGQCDGYMERMHEKLEEEHGIRIGYSTLTRKIRELGLGRPKDQRCDQVPDQPGQEMQHDTSTYQVTLGERRLRLVGSLIYLRYSKCRYLKFYRFFNRFTMKCFLHEALTHWGWTASNCIIDNTNLARLRGTGKHAVIVPEMEQFAGRYGFQFICHELGHANRKAGNERSFYTVETNFFPGRQFESLEGLNRQAFDWATVKFANRPMSKTGLIPARAFEYEQSYLNQLPSYITPPYVDYTRHIDQYGYIAVNGNFYWVPGLKRYEVKVIQFPDAIKIYHHRDLLIEYRLPDPTVKNEKFSPPGRPKPKYQPENRKHSTHGEEKKLRAISKGVDTYLNFVLSQAKGKHKHHFIRQLYYLSKKMTAELFDQAVERALTYRIKDVDMIERIAALIMKEAHFQMPQVAVHEQFMNRPSFLEGRFTDEADLSAYGRLKEDDHG